MLDTRPNLCQCFVLFSLNEFYQMITPFSFNRMAHFIYFESIGGVIERFTHILGTNIIEIVGNLSYFRFAGIISFGHFDKVGAEQDRVANGFSKQGIFKDYVKYLEFAFDFVIVNVLVVI